MSLTTMALVSSWLPSASRLGRVTVVPAPENEACRTVPGPTSDAAQPLLLGHLTASMVRLVLAGQGDTRQYSVLPFVV